MEDEKMLDETREDEKGEGWARGERTRRERNKRDRKEIRNEKCTSSLFDCVCCLVLSGSGPPRISVLLHS
jgi:hypothetical protein